MPVVVTVYLFFGKDGRKSPRLANRQHRIGGRLVKYAQPTLMAKDGEFTTIAIPNTSSTTASIVSQSRNHAASPFGRNANGTPSCAAKMLP